jgi:glycosyltransferase involved in cell wall biosynthesis
MPLRIAHVITESNLGGAQRNTLLTIRGLRAGGLDVELVCGPGGELIEEARAIGARVHVVPELVRPIDPVRDVQATLALCALFRRRRYRVVHTHCFKAGLVGRAAAWWAGVRVVLHTVHGVPFELGRDLRSGAFLMLERLAARASDRIICVGETFRRQLASWRLAPEAKLVTVYSGLEFDAYVPRRGMTEVRDELGFDGAWPIVGSVGRLCDQKAQHYLVEAVARLRTTYPRIRLVLVGDGPLRPRLEAMVRQLGCADVVHFLGERDDVPDLLPVFDVYAMSSRWEGLGRATSEAMLCGRPVVATDVDGVRELIVHRQTGLLVPPRDPAALAAGIGCLVADRDLAGRLAVTAEHKVRALLSAERMVADLRRLYDGLLRRTEIDRPSAEVAGRAA